MRPAPTSVRPGCFLRDRANRGRGWAVLVAALAVACSDDPTDPGDDPGVEIASVEPAPLQEGETATIRGQGFQEDDLTITIAGLEAPILSVAPETVRVEVPLLCRPQGEVEVGAIVGGEQPVTVLHPIQGSGPSLEMEAGEFRYLPDPGEFCLLFRETDEDEAYLFGVQSTAGPGSLTPVHVSAGTADGGPVVMGAAPAPGPAEEPVAREGTLRAGTNQALDHATRSRWREHRAAEASIRQRDRAFVKATVAQMEDPLRDVAPSTTASIPAGVSEGDTLDVRVPDLNAGDFCEEYVPITTVAEAVGDEAVWLVDVENPTEGGFSQSDYQGLSEEFDASIHPALEEHFGSPAPVGELDRMAVVATRVVNQFDPAPLGFVVSADFVPRSDEPELDGACRSSDHANVFYTQAPGGENGLDRETALLEFPRLAAHEATHVIQFGRRITEGRSLPEIWELEGQAVLGEEVAGHRDQGNEARQNLSIVDEALPNGVEEGETLWYFFAFFDLFKYFGLTEENGLGRAPNAPEECSWLAQDIEEAPCELDRREPYGVAWTFLRWLADQVDDDLPDGEATFHQAMIDSDEEGFTNVEEIVGEPWEELLAQWAATLYADGRVEGDPDPRIAFPSWDLDDELASETRLQPRERPFGAFSDDVQVRGGSSAYFVLSGEERPATGVRARTLEGDLLPSSAQMWVVRLR